MPQLPMPLLLTLLQAPQQPNRLTPPHQMPANTHQEETANHSNSTKEEETNNNNNKHQETPPKQPNRLQLQTKPQLHQPIKPQPPPHQQPKIQPKHHPTLPRTLHKVNGDNRLRTETSGTIRFQTRIGAQCPFRFRIIIRVLMSSSIMGSRIVREAMRFNRTTKDNSNNTTKESKPTKETRLRLNKPNKTEAAAPQPSNKANKEESTAANKSSNRPRLLQPPPPPQKLPIPHKAQPIQQLHQSQLPTNRRPLPQQPKTEASSIQGEI